MRLPGVCVLAGALATACASSPSGPSPATTGQTLQGQVVSAIDGAAAAGVAVRIGDTVNVTTDGDGRFSAGVSGPGTYPAVVTGSLIVERRTMVSAPTAQPARLSLIPTSFDLMSFDQMFRASNGQLHRWTDAPSLVVLATVMAYRGGSGDQYSAVEGSLTDAEVSQLTAHLTEGLSFLTGGTFKSFANVTVERPSSGDRVTVGRPGSIVVGRYTGVVSFAHTIGFGQWADAGDGTVTGGAIFLDNDFDREDQRRRLLRIHELGHALGYLHVTARTSIMNPSIGPEPTEFDRTGAIVAFQRPPGNTAPDTDPGTALRSGGTGWSVHHWRPPIACQLAPVPQPRHRSGVFGRRPI